MRPVKSCGGSAGSRERSACLPACHFPERWHAARRRHNPLKNKVLVACLLGQRATCQRVSDLLRLALRCNRHTSGRGASVGRQAGPVRILSWQQSLTGPLVFHTMCPEEREQTAPPLSRTHAAEQGVSRASHENPEDIVVAGGSGVADDAREYVEALHSAGCERGASAHALAGSEGAVAVAQQHADLVVRRAAGNSSPHAEREGASSRGA